MTKATKTQQASLADESTCDAKRKHLRWLMKVLAFGNVLFKLHNQNNNEGVS